MTGIAIRAARPADAAAIRMLLTDAFGGPAEAALVEAALVEALRAAGDLVLERIAVVGEEIVGHVGYARLSVAAAGEAAAAVAPASSSSSAKAEDPGLAQRKDGSSALTEDDEPRRAACIVALAPLAVAAPWRRRGIGEALVRSSLEELRTSGCDLVLVLGDPAYYGRFGFVPAAELSLRSPYDGPHQQALALTERGRTARGLRVTYPTAFAGLE